MSGPNKTHKLRNVDINVFSIQPDRETTLRGRTAYGIDRGTGTTSETRTAAQSNVPTRVEAIYHTNQGRTGRYGADNPPPQQRPGISWTSWGAGIGAVAGAYFGETMARNALSGVMAESGALATSTMGGALGGMVGAGLGAIADYITAPRYDAGHMRPRQLGGAGHLDEAVFGQNPQINRGNHLNGQPTYDMFRRGENTLTDQMRQDGGGQLTFKTYRK